MVTYKTLHSDFRLNGLSYSFDALKDLAYDLVKEGSAHEKATGNFFQDWCDDKDYVKVNTSGSTGKPKEILLKKVHMVNSALATGEYFGLNPATTALMCLSANYIAGKMMLVRAMVLGLELDYVQPSSSPLSGISKKYDFCTMVPMQTENSLNTLDELKTLIIGGAPISNALSEKLQNTRCEVFETYGMTETITHVAVKRINKLKSSSHLELVKGQVGTSFHAMPSVSFTKDKRDCLIIDAPKISKSQVVTNDVVNLISKTEFKWLGRFDNVINSGGVKLFPEQIEEKLVPLIPQRFFVIGRPDAKLGEKLVLLIEGEVNIQELSTKIAALSSVGRYEIPREIHLLPTFAETQTGKIRRKETLNLLKG